MALIEDIEFVIHRRLKFVPPEDLSILAISYEYKHSFAIY
jgi:hypothetical protein